MRRRCYGRLVHLSEKAAKTQRSLSVLLGDLCVFAIVSDKYTSREQLPRCLSARELGWTIQPGWRRRGIPRPSHGG
jgi:hypothetical protein